MSVAEIVDSLDGWAIERLETEITLVAAHLAAAECRWLQLVAEFDRRDGWTSWGCASTAHWLNFRCGIDLGTARERVRVARRLVELPLLTASFATGKLSYSKVRAVTRIATEANEEVLVELAGSMTASHLERTVRCYRLADEAANPERDDPVAHYRDRYLTTRWNDDGSLSIRANLPPAEGMMVVEALRRASDALYRDADPPDDVPAETSEANVDVPAGTSDSDAGAESPEPSDPWGAQQADALVAIAETIVADGLRPGRGPSRHLVVIHTNAAGLTGDDHSDADTPDAYLDDGPALRSDTVRRLMCDSSAMFALEGPDGKVVNVSPRAPTIPPALARAVRLRDGCCVFPGCTRRAFVDVHHIRHRIDGGENTLANTCALCRVHHRMEHEGGYSMTVREPGSFQFARPDGTPITTRPVTVAAGDELLRHLDARGGVHPTEETPVPDWDGRHPDYPLIVDALLQAEGRLWDTPPTNN